MSPMLLLKQALTAALLAGGLAAAQAQTVSGLVVDSLTGETLIGATVVELGSGKGTVSNAAGRYSLTLNADSVRLRFSHTGYRPLTVSLPLGADVRHNAALVPSVELEEVEISARRAGSATAAPMSTLAVPVEQIKMVPVLFGETDVFKAIQLLPGVQGGTEGTSGIYVRGGGPDENLFLLDGVPLYNVNHLGGFFSAFNSEAVKSLTLYKGAFPSRFAGRISSVVDIATNDGNDKELHGGASVGLIAANVGLEGPIVKERTTFSLSLRRTYGDLLLQPLLALSAASEPGAGRLGAGYYFYDLNAKLTHRFSDRSRLYASLYNGDDKAFVGVTYNDRTAGADSERSRMDLGYKWGNTAAALRWNYELSPRLFMNLGGSYSRYRNRLGMGITEDMTIDGDFFSEEAELTLNSGIRDLTAKADFDYAPSPDHTVRFGSALTHHLFTPQTTSAHLAIADNDTSAASDTTFGESRLRAWEATLYAEDDWSIGQTLKINYGAALCGFAVGGRFYPSVQPRLSGRWQLGSNLSVKAGYSYMTQYMHLLSSSNISLPSDLWVPVTAQIAPMNSHQVAAGMCYSWRSLLDFSAEAYYKSMDNLMEYRPGSSFFGNSARWEEKVCLGRGWAYGVEWMVQKSTGKLTGWVAYTWSRTWRLFDELNNGERFPAKYDRIHDISLSLQYRHSERIDAGLTWVYSTGNTATLATQEFTGPEQETYIYVESRNNFRLPAYHRMDLGLNFHRRLRHGRRTLNISIYNLYNRRNPFLLYKSYRYGYTAGGTRYNSALVQLTLFPVLPTLTYTYRF